MSLRTFIYCSSFFSNYKFMPKNSEFESRKIHYYKDFDMSVTIQKWKKSHAGVLMLKLLSRKLQRVIWLLPGSRTRHNIVEFDENVAEKIMVPEDVKEGHFAVIAVKGEKQKRFILELSYLRNPEFLGLLELAKEEFGFQQKNVLLLPCEPEELQKILEGSTKIFR